jgi:hypothetical protein
VPPPGSVVLNLVALYADPDFWVASYKTLLRVSTFLSLYRPSASFPLLNNLQQAVSFMPGFLARTA